MEDDQLPARTSSQDLLLRYRRSHLQFWLEGFQRKYQEKSSLPFVLPAPFVSV